MSVFTNNRVGDDCSGTDMSQRERHNCFLDVIVIKYASIHVGNIAEEGGGAEKGLCTAVWILKLVSNAKDLTLAV